MECSVKMCQQLVLGKEEKAKDKPMCYFHRKCRDGLFGKPYTYPGLSPNNRWYDPAVPEVAWTKTLRWSWDLTTD
jgi:hypothetical protein